MKRSTARITATALLAMAIAGCSGGGDDQAPPPMVNEMPFDEMTPEPSPLPTEEPAPSPTPVAPPSPIVPEDAFSDEEQIQLDAEASGMTSRVDRGTPTPAPVQ